MQWETSRADATELLGSSAQAMGRRQKALSSQVTQFFRHLSSTQQKLFMYEQKQFHVRENANCDKDG